MRLHIGPLYVKANEIHQVYLQQVASGERSCEYQCATKSLPTKLRFTQVRASAVTALAKFGLVEDAETRSSIRVLITRCLDGMSIVNNIYLKSIANLPARR